MATEPELRSLLRFHRWRHTKELSRANFWRSHVREAHHENMAYHRERARAVIAKLKEIRNEQRHQTG
jgi:hypothetical protein